jgi:hypothetical protein
LETELMKYVKEVKAEDYISGVASKKAKKDDED